MELIVIVLLMLASFFFVVYIPTVLFLKGKKNKKKDYESLIVFVAASFLYLLLAYICVNFYELKAVEETVECSVLANMNCLFNEELPKVIRPELSIYMVLFTQLIVMVTYAYYTAISVMQYKSRIRITTNLILFFFVSIVASILHYFVLYDSAFVSGLKYITLFSANAYIILPFMYLVVMTYINRDQIKIK